MSAVTTVSVCCAAARIKTDNVTQHNNVNTIFILLPSLVLIKYVTRLRLLLCTVPLWLLHRLHVYLPPGLLATLFHRSFAKCARLLIVVSAFCCQNKFVIQTILMRFFNLVIFFKAEPWWFKLINFGFLWINKKISGINSCEIVRKNIKIKNNYADCKSSARRYSTAPAPANLPADRPRLEVS